MANTAAQAGGEPLMYYYMAVPQEQQQQYAQGGYGGMATLGLDQQGCMRQPMATRTGTRTREAAAAWGGMMHMHVASHVQPTSMMGAWQGPHSSNWPMLPPGSAGHQHLPASSSSPATNATRTPKQGSKACKIIHPATKLTIQEEDEGVRHQMVAEWDDEGVFFYQAFSDGIADRAVEHQRLDGPSFSPAIRKRMWIKPSLAGALFSAGYGRKDPSQRRLVKVKLPHEAAAAVLQACSPRGDGQVQWDPARSLWHGCAAKIKKNVGRGAVEPARAQGPPGCAIQIGMRGELVRLYVDSVLSVEDVTSLACRIHDAHLLWERPEEEQAAMASLREELPRERPYTPRCSDEVIDLLHLSRQ